MKIFNIENGERKVYIQMSDIMMLNRTGRPILDSIYEKISTGIIAADGSDRMDFVKFSQSKEIEFFESMDWIIDYKRIRDVSEEEIKAKCQEISTEMNQIANRIEAMSDEEKREHQLLASRYDLLDHKMKCLAEILLIKQGHQQMSFPVVPDSDGFSFVGDNNCDYEIRISLDPNKLLLFRKDGRKLTNDEIIPQGFLQAGLSIAIMERVQSDEFFGDYEMSNSLSEDGRYLVMEFKVKCHENDGEDKAEKSGIKKLIKKLFNKVRK